MLEIVNTPEPLFVTVTGCGALVAPTATVPNERLDADRMTEDVLPVRFRTCGLPGALSTIVMDAFRIPCAVGVKVALIVHVPPTGKEAPQVLVEAKSPGSAPVTEMLEMVRGLSPFVIVTVCGRLVAPRLNVGNVRPEGLTAIPAKMLTFEMNASQLPPGLD